MAEAAVENTYAHPLLVHVEVVADDAGRRQTIWSRSHGDLVRGTLIIAVAVALLAGLVLLPATLHAAPVPRREDIGDLVGRAMEDTHPSRRQHFATGEAMEDTHP